MKKYLLISLLCLISTYAVAQRVSDLQSAQLPLSGNELMSLSQNGVTKRVPTSALMLGSLVLGVANGGTGLSALGGPLQCLQVNSSGTALQYGSCGSGGGGGTPGGLGGQIQYNNAGLFGGFTASGDCTINTATGAVTCSTIGGISPFSASNLTSGTVPTARLLVATTTSPGIVSIGSGLNVSSTGATSVSVGNGLVLSATGSVTGAFATTTGLGEIIVGSGLAITATGVLSATVTGGTLPSQTGHAFEFLSTNGSTVNWSNPASFVDPRSYGAICGGVDTFAGNGSQTAFTYTIPFVGSSSTDNSSFFVYYEPTSGFGTSTILSSGDFSVTGVNSGSGGTITLNSPVPASNTLIVAHDDGPGLISASNYSVTKGLYIAALDGCSIYTSQTNGTQLAEGAQLIGESFTPNYAYADISTKPIIYVLAPISSVPNFGFNVTGKTRQLFQGFTITSRLPGLDGIGFLKVPVLIGANGASGAGGGSAPGITVQYVTFNAGIVGFGAPIGGNSNYIFSTLRYNNFVANTAGTFGPISDPEIIGNVFTSNGGFGSVGSSGGLVLGPKQGAPGNAGAGRVVNNRFEYNSDGVLLTEAGLTNFEGNHFDANAQCGIAMRGAWDGVNITGGWFRANGLGGQPFSGNATAGQDAHVCITAAGHDLHISNVLFFNGYGRGYTQPIGTANANTPKYFLDITATGANVSNITVNGGELLNSTTVGSYVTDISIYRNGSPSNVSYDVKGQAIYGKIANGLFSSQASGLPANSWTALTAVGDIVTLNNQLAPVSEAYPNLVARSLGTGATVYGLNSFSTPWDCEIVQQQIFPNVNSGASNNPVVIWQSSSGDPSFGGGFFASHRTDTNSCRMAGLTWMAIPTEYKVYGQNATSCVPTGTWLADTSTGSYGTGTGGTGGTYGITSNTNGDSLACTTTTYGGPIYLWYQMRGSNGGAFTWNLDGTTTGTILTQGQNDFTFPITTASKTVGAVRIPVPASGSHTVTATLTSTTSVSNTVTILGIGTTPGKAMTASQPSVFYGNQIPNTTYTDATTAFTSDQLTQTYQLFSDGLAVNYVDVQKYLNASTDYGVNGFAGINNNGQTHIADAFISKMQGKKTSMNAIDPRDYGAACNSLYFSSAYTSTQYNVSTTASSADISILNYKFQPGVATARGGGDVGKRICIGPGTDGGDEGPCTYVASVNTTTNKATLGRAMVNTKTGHYAVMGGYPTNPAEPSTAVDDTIPIQRAAAAALLGGGKVFLPNNCMVHDLNLPRGITLEGNSPGDYYLVPQQDITGSPQATVLNCGITGFSSDTPQCIRSNPQTRLKNFLIRAPTFPYTPFNISSACIGYSTAGTGDGGPGAQVLTDHLSFFGCPISIGQAYGYNYQVNFTASISDNGNGTSTMAVSSIDSTNFYAPDHWTFSASSKDFLALNRPVSGPGVTAGTIITYVPPGSSAGNYILNKAMTVSSTGLTSARQTLGLEVRDEFSQHIVGGIAYNGDFTDTMITGSTCTGTFMAGCVRGGPVTASFGCGAIRWIGGRMEEMGNAAVTMDGCGIEMTGADLQFNGGYNLRTLGTGSYINMTGGHLYAGGHCSGYGNTSISIGGANPNVSLTGVTLSTNDFGSGCGGSTTKLFVTATGATGVQASITGGIATITGDTVTSLYDWTNATPTKYKQSTAGWPIIDYSQSALSVSSTGGVGIGTAVARNGTSLDLLGNTTTANSSIGFPKHTTANRPTNVISGMVGYNTDLNVLDYYNGSSWTVVGSGSGGVTPGAFGGLTLSNDGGSPNTVIDIAAGGAASDDNSVLMTTAAVTKTTGSWVVGSGNGCLDTGAIANSTWYHVFLIERPDTAVIDELCSTSATAPTMPTNYTLKRRIGSFKTDGSANIVPFTQVGSTYYWATPTLDVTTTTLGTTAGFQTLNVPTGVQVSPLCNVSIATGSPPVSLYLTSSDETDLATTTTTPFSAAPGYSYLSATATGAPSNAACPFLTTNTSGQVRARASGANTSVSIITRGWQD